MKYIYLGVSDLYLPATTAAIHLEQLDSLHGPTQQKLKSLSYFRTVGKEDDGKLYFAGRDNNDNEVYIASIKGHPDVAVRAVQSLLGLYQMSLSEVQVIPCLPENPQISLVCSVFKQLGLQNVADYVGYKLVNNRFTAIVKSVRREPV
ncbi:DUF3189 family protein [Dethiobacter alkaliphilus]|uniref:Uncharacterized protein n=1 Tax=Dethiobacter alkaliphilus AHT 1 TaxID=555088 RepID=C0GI41_DETAL|nr:DUF3189 family protein [Dethiobacter alkaliphilus]EEG77115.1 hypothetical protein DealDRAFT_2150 [Dethiobacter alkaliphilus AHT 1]